MSFFTFNTQAECAFNCITIKAVIMPMATWKNNTAVLLNVFGR